MDPNTKNPMIGAYIRVSSSRQGEGESPENQRERLQAAGANEFYTDTVSGYKLRQRRKALEFERLVADIKAGRLTKLLTTRLDRIVRRDAIFMELSELCDQHSVEFLSLQSGKVDTSTTAGWLSVKMQLMLAEHYSRQLSENVRNGLAAQIARGVHTRPNTSLPFHLAPDPNSRRGVVPGEAWDDARHCIDQMLAGNWSLAEASRFLDANHGRMSRPNSLSRWLRSPSLAGHACDMNGKIQIAACWPALVTEAEHEQLLDGVEKRRNKWGVNFNLNKEPKALSGLCLCLHCGNRMANCTSRTGKYTYQYLRCTSRQRCPFANKNLQAIAIEQMLLIEYVIPEMESIINSMKRKALPQMPPPPEKREWLRELRHRKQTPPEFLMPSDRERINELEILVARASDPIPTVNTPDLSLLALRLTNATLGKESSWFSDPPPVRNQNLQALLQSVTIDALKHRIASVTFALERP
jgi:DNA invertase Pin-like site-specific DNA recombinase